MSIYIETTRLIIRTPVLEDVAMIQAAKIAVWDDLRKWMSWAVRGTETVEALRDHFIAFAEEKNHLIATIKDKGQFVLCTGATPLEKKGQFEVGYWAAKDMRGFGYTTEASNAVLRYAFNALGAEEIYICHYQGNVPSRKVIEKLGFTKTGVTAKAHTRDFDGAVLDRHEYIMRDPTVLPELEVRWRPRCR
jgi:[ribosomal protein S5]-alanine N-acetyltransferase